MNKKTIVIVSLTLVLALLAVSAIATFPTYLFEDTSPEGSSSIQSGSMSENEKLPNDDTGIIVDDEVIEDNQGTEGVLPSIIPEKPESEQEKEDNESSTETNYSQYETVTTAKNVKVYADYGAYPDGTKVKIKKLGILNKAYYRARHYLKGTANKFSAYNFTATKDGSTVAPIAPVVISFTIPSNYNSKNVAVYYILENGVIEIDCEISKDGKTANVNVMQSGVYILVEKSEKDETELSSSNNSSSTSSDTSSLVSSNTSSDATSEDGSSSELTSSDDNTSSGLTSDDSNSENNSSNNTSSDNASSVDPNKESMDGWTP